MPTTADYDGWDDWDDEPPPRPAPPSCCWPQCPKPASADYDLPLCTAHATIVHRTVTEHGLQPHLQSAPPTTTAKPRRANKGLDLPGVVYFLGLGDHIKIGHARNLGTRMLAYPPTSTILAVQPGTMKLETALHRRFQPWVIAGREWYHDTSGEIATYIAAVREHWAPPTCHITQSALLNRYSRSLSGEPDQLLFPPRPT